MSETRQHSLNYISKVAAVKFYVLSCAIVVLTVAAVMGAVWVYRKNSRLLEMEQSLLLPPPVVPEATRF